MSETNRAQLAVLQEMSSWCLQDLGTKMNRTKIETLVTIQVKQTAARTPISDLDSPAIIFCQDGGYVMLALVFPAPCLTESRARIVIFLLIPR